MCFYAEEAKAETLNNLKQIMKHLKLSREKALEAYTSGDAERKQFLIDLYGKENFLVDVKDRVTDYESACEELGISPLSIGDFSCLPEEDRDRAFNRHQLTIGIRALVEGWKPDFKNHDEYKYYNYFYFDSSGKISSGVDYFYYRYSFVGFDLCIKTRKKAEIIEKIFRQEYIDYLH